MSTHELIELAVLDAMGILEPHEADEFERAFAGASDGVRAQVRAEQARLVDIEDLLPEDQPRPELRGLVLAAVRAAIDTDRQPVAGRIGARAPVQPRIRNANRVSPAWRAASVALAAVVVSLLVFNAQTRQIFSQAQQQAMVNNFYDLVGPELVGDLLTDPSTTRLVFTSAKPVETPDFPMAAAWHNDRMNGTSQLFFTNLKGSDTDRYRVAVLDSEGNVVQELTTFESTGQLEGVEIKVDLRTLNQPLAITRIAGDARSDFTADEILLVSKTQS